MSSAGETARHPDNQHPPNLTRDQLPAWASAAVAALEAAQRGEPGDSYDLGDEVSIWHYPKLRAWVITPPPSTSLALALLALAWPIGLGVIGWAVVGLKEGGGPWWLWVIGVALTLIGCVTLPRWSAQRAAPRRAPTVLTPDGMVRADGEHHRIAARADIVEFALSDGGREGMKAPKRWTCAIVAGRHWCQFSAPLEGDSAERISALHEALVAWHQTGDFPRPEGTRGPQPVQVSPLSKSTAKLLAGSVGVAAFVWVTMVLPSTSEGGQTASRFVALVGAGDYRQAHAMLCREQRERLDAAALEAALGDELEGATALDVNGISGGVGSTKGSTQCVDGSLEGVEGEPRFSVDMVAEDDGWRIEAWRMRHCPRRGP